jgi:glycosyltransferase involved in cell wall biosynthesis
MLLSLAEKRFLASVDGFIHNSETTRRKVASLVKHNRPQVVAYPAGDRFQCSESPGSPGSPLSTEFIGKRARRPGPLQLLFLGNVIPRKGLLPLLQALSGIHREVWHLSIVGGLDFDSDYTAKARQLVRQLGLSDSVLFLGPLQEAELVEVLRTSHVFCMPYAYEGFGIAILESMAFGLPGIGCQNGAAGETISHGVNGFLLAEGDLAGLEPLLIQMHKDRETLLQLALAARATYLGHPTWQESIAAIDNFLQGLVDLRNQKKLFSPVRKPETSEPRNSDATR